MTETETAPSVVGSAPPTLEDVARVAGVSRATVSRVVNGQALVAPATVESVQRAIAELGYAPNRAARALVTRRSGVVAVIVPETDERVFSDPFYSQMYHGVMLAFRGDPTQVVLAMGQPGAGADRMVDYLDSGHVDGGIIVSHHGPGLAAALSRGTKPVVFVGDPGVPGVPYVELDNEGAARTATEYLLARGSRHPATITGPMEMPPGANRLAGFLAAVGAAGLATDAVAPADFTAAGGQAAARQLIERFPETDGLFVASDLMASGAMLALAAAGRRVPDDVLVVGFDNSSAALQTAPALTTMVNPVTEMARTAGEMLADLLAGRTPAEPVLFFSSLVRRESA